MAPASVEPQVPLWNKLFSTRLPKERITKKRVSEKLGEKYEALVKVAETAKFMINKGAVIKDQLDLLATIPTLLVFYDLRGYDVREEFPLIQLYLCKETSLKMEGVMEWADYWYESEAETEAAADAEADAKST